MTVLDPELYKIIRAEMERTDIPNRDRFVNVTRMVQDALDAQAAEIAELRRLLTDVVVAAGRMTDRWAESDDAVRLTLWRNLHTAAEAAHDEVYPLASERTSHD